MKKPMKIVLVNPEDIRRRKRMSEQTPFAGLAFLAAYAGKCFGNDIDVEIIEMLPQRYGIKDVASRIRETGATLCGITAKTYNYPFSLEVAEAIKAASPKTLVIYGGAHATALPHDVAREKAADAVIRSEGEQVFNNVIENLLASRHPFRGVNGVVYSDGGEIADNGNEELIRDIDTIPTPDWGKYYDLDLYDRYYDRFTGKHHLLLPVFASRGCPYGCQFCQPVLSRKHRARPVSSVLDEVQYLHDRYGISRIYFEDSIFGIRKEWFLEFCSGYKERGLHNMVKWGYETNVNNIDLERTRAARDAGCVYVYFGMESASDTVLQHLGKRATRQKLSAAIAMAKAAGIREVVGSFIFGLPYENSDTAGETIDFIRSSSLDGVNINLLDVYPGTELHAMVENGQGGIQWIPGKKDKWDACGRTLVKTIVNDLDTEEKLEALYLKTLRIVHDKYRKSPYSYLRQILSHLLYYSMHNPEKLRQSMRHAMAAYFPERFRLN
ncbi:MAG: radical SAM protein [Nitrospiraceae bacterium]|nr:radical SAM protein [Nitrospiraceae bacterium]